jgi:hypothetical protein
MPQKARRKIYAVQGAFAGILCLSFLLPHDLHMFRADDKEKTYIYINKDGNPSTKSTRHVDTNVNTPKENQDHQNSSLKWKT